MSIIAAVIWLATIGTLVLRCGLERFFQFESFDSEVIFFSNVGASHRPGFILGTGTTAIPYFISVVFYKLYYDLEPQQLFKQIISILIVITSFIVAVTLFLLAIYDYQTAHFIILGFFIVFLLITSSLTIVYRFNKNYLNWILDIHAFLIGASIALSITFIVITSIGVKDRQGNLESIGASLEWAIALLIVFNFALYAIDMFFFPIKKLRLVKMRN